MSSKEKQTSTSDSSEENEHEQIPMSTKINSNSFSTSNENNNENNQNIENYEDEENQHYTEEYIEEVTKKHPNCCQIAFFQRAPKYIHMGRKGSLHVKELGQIPSNLNIEQTYDKYKSAWKMNLKQIMKILHYSKL